MGQGYARGMQFLSEKYENWNTIVKTSLMHLKKGEPQRWDAGTAQADVYNCAIDLVDLAGKGFRLQSHQSASNFDVHPRSKRVSGESPFHLGQRGVNT